ncbi:MAG TPA: carotenoid oxygenase family protein, partial [Geobacteraceae bacterium]
GMVQAFTFHEQGVHYRNRFVRTRKYTEEEAAGTFVFPSWSTQAPGGLLANFWAADKILNQAGVTVYLRNGRLFAFDETGLPYELDPQTLATIGPSTFGLDKDATVYGPHSKMDPLTGEWLHFGIRYGPKPLIHITVFARDGSLRQHRSFALPRYVYMHDWLVSDRHFIVSFHPAEIHFWGFLLGLRSLADSLSWNPGEGNLLMILERSGAGEPLFVATDACFMWHSVNACESGGEIRADFVGYANPDHFIGKNPVVTAMMTGRRGDFSSPGELRRYVIDPAGKRIRQEVLDRGSYEWPRVNEVHRCHRYRFGYMVKQRAGEFFWSYVTRVDVLTGASESYDFGPGVYCCEPVFVPIPGREYGGEDRDEPGWLLTEGYDSHTRKGFLAVLRAERLADGPLAVVWLQHHVPFSFHGWWAAG